MSKGYITLHPEHGVNPTLGVCLWCGEEDGTLALLGYNKGREAPRKSIVSTEPCDTCKAGMAQGITLIEAYGYKADRTVELREGTHITGRWTVVTEDAVRRWFDAATAEAVLRHRKAFLHPEAYSAIFGKGDQK